jgi:hypothetical protein
LSERGDEREGTAPSAGSIAIVVALVVLLILFFMVTGAGCAPRAPARAPAATQTTAADVAVTGRAAADAADPLRGVDLGSDAVRELATALCDRAEACDEVGPNRIHSTPGDCETWARGEVQRRVDDLACAFDLDYRGVDRCAEAARNAGCDSPLDTVLDDLGACRKSRLCLH